MVLILFAIVIALTHKLIPGFVVFDVSATGAGLAAFWAFVHITRPLSLPARRHRAPRNRLRH